MTNYLPFFSRAADRLRESAIRKMGTAGARMPDLISFAPGYPDPETFPWTPLAEQAARLLRDRDVASLQYGPTRGFAPLVDALEEVLGTRGIASTAAERLITTGSQQGLDLAARVLVDPGDVVLVELPTYTGAITALANAQAELVGVRQETDGIDLVALDDTLSRLRAAGRRVRLLYLVPNFQNPTGLLIGLEKRRRLLAWAEARDVLILEDDPYGDLFFPDTAEAGDTRPLKAEDHDGRVVYLSSFSKTLAPGFRVAWLVAPAPVAARMEIAKQATDICTGAFDQRLVHQAIVSGVLAGQAPVLRARYQYKRTVMEEALRRELGDALSWHSPRGGFFLWARLPAGVDGERLLARALDERVSYVVGSAFFVDGSGAEMVRLSFSQPAPDRIDEGIRRLARAIRAAATDYSEPLPAGSGTSAPSG